MNLKAFLFFIITAVMSVGVFILAIFFASMETIERFLKFLFVLGYKIVGIDIKVNGEENIDKKKAYIYVSNHSSLIDIPSIKLSLPTNLKYIAKKELFRIPIFGFALYRIGQIPIDRSNRRKAIESLNLAKERLRTGTSIWMAPEGTRNVSGDVGVFKKGAFVTAAQAGVEIVPVSLCGTWKILPKKTLKLNSGKIDVFIHKPIKIDKESVQSVLEEARTIISKDIKTWKEANE